MFGECIEEASKLRELSPKELSRIAELASIGIFEARDSDLSFIQNEIYRISKERIKKCFFGDGCLFAMAKSGYLGDFKAYLLKYLDGKDYKDRKILRHSFLTYD